MTTIILSQTDVRPLLSPLGEGYGALTCPECGDPCGFLFEGLRCLGCETGWNETLNEYETREADEFWGAAEMACTTCGID